MKSKRAILVFLSLIDLITMTAYAGWQCSCGNYSTTKFCTSCGKKEPPPKVNTPPKRSYTPPKRSEPEWYKGKQVMLTPIQIGFIGPDVATPPGEHYTVCGLCTDPFVSSVVNSYGIQIAGLSASTRKTMYGLQISGVATSAKEIGGVQIGCFNNANYGVGVQIGVVNQADNLSGLQIGAINKADRLEGVQLGVINTIKNADLPVLPIINASF